MQSPLIPLESIQIATPCRADWSAMQKVHGNACIRFCPSCGKNVYDLSGLTRDEAMGLIAAKEGNLCLRLHRRSDGTVITSDCPVGKSARIKRNMLFQMFVAVVGFGTATLAAGNMLFHRFTDKANTINPQKVAAKLATARPTSTPLPTATATPTPFPTPRPERPASESEGIRITNGQPESPTPHLPDDSSVTVTMGAPCPPPEPMPTRGLPSDTVFPVPSSSPAP